MADFKHISIVDTAQHLADKSATICDIRDEASFKSRHIDGSFHLNNFTMAEFMRENEFDRPVIVVCYHGHSSQGAAQYLAQQGFEEVYSMDGGFEGWAISQPFSAS